VGEASSIVKGFLQRRQRVLSDTLVFDLQFRLCCRDCNRLSGFRITIFDELMRDDNSKPRLEWVGGFYGIDMVNTLRFV